MGGVFADHHQFCHGMKAASLTGPPSRSPALCSEWADAANCPDSHLQLFAGPSLCAHRPESLDRPAVARPPLMVEDAG
jgi:hypothetical protein